MNVLHGGRFREVEGTFIFVKNIKNVDMLLAMIENTRVMAAYLFSWREI